MQENQQSEQAPTSRHGVMIFDLEGVLLEVSESTRIPGKKALKVVAQGVELLRSISHINHFAVIITDLDQSYAVDVQAILKYYAPELICGLDYGLYMQPMDATNIPDLREKVIENWHEYAKENGGKVALGVVYSEDDLESFTKREIAAAVYTRIAPFKPMPLEGYPSPYDPSVAPADDAAIIEAQDRLGLLSGDEGVVIEGERMTSLGEHVLVEVQETGSIDPAQCTGCAPICGDCSGDAELATHIMPNEESAPYDRGLDQMAKYPAYWRPLPKKWQCIDYYRVASLFPLNDPSQRLEHARKKLMLGGLRTGGKTLFDDIREARDTLTGWLIDNDPLSVGEAQVSDTLDAE